MLPDAYSINNLTFNANNATATARRLAGSTAVGDIAAGAIAGKANGSGDTNSIATIENLTVNLNTCSINAFGYSFDSDNRYLQYGYSSYWLGGSYWNGNNTTTVLEGNNVYAGGVIGYVCNYGDYDNSNQSNNIGLNYITVNFDRSLNNSDYAVYGIQNAVSGNDDYKTEGYVGGMFGMMESGYATNLTVNGTSKDRTVIYFNSTNDPNTSSVGGLIGATRNLQGVEDDSYAVTNSKVTDVHVAGRAYVQEEVQTSDWRWDIYVGGAIGVFGTANKNSAGTGLKGSNFARGITVEDCAIEAIGDEAMLTYAGGVFGGVWWVSSANISNCISRNNSVLASSATFNTFAAGIVGLLQAGTVENCLVINNTIDAITYSTNTSVSGSEVRAYAAGICARVYQSSSTIQNNISNAVVSASAPYITSSGYAVMAGIGITDGGNVESTNYFVAANIEVDNIDNAYAVRTRDGSYPPSNNSYAIALRGSGENNTSNADNDYETSVNTDVTQIYYDLNFDLKDLDGNSASEFNDIRVANNNNLLYTVKIVGEGEATLTVDNETLGWIIPTTTYFFNFRASNPGTYYIQLIVQNAAGSGKDYLLCSYPIIVENASTSEGVTITTPDFTTASGNNAFVNAENSNNYYTSSEQIEGATTYNFKNYNWGTTEGNEIDINNQTVLGNSVFTVLPAENAGTNKIRKNSTNLDDIDLPDGVSASDTHLYINGSFDADTKTDGIMFSAKWQATLYVAAATNNSGKAITPHLYSSDLEEIELGISEVVSGVLAITIPAAGTYYFGFSGNSYNIFSLELRYDDDSAHSANSGTTYFQIYAGDMSYVQNVIVSNSNVYMPEIYLVTNSDYLCGYRDGENADNNFVDEDWFVRKVEAMTTAGVASSITGVMSYFNVSTTDDGKGLNISPVLGNTMGAALVLVYDCDQPDPYYVIIEVVPNAIVGLSIAPAADTPPRAIADNGNYIYASGETVRLEAEVEYRFSYNRFIVDAQFTRAGGNSSSTVQPNGTVLVSGSSLQTVVVSCSPISDGSAIDNMSATLTIEISNSITVVADDMSGTSYAPVSDNDAVAGYPFSFTLDPNPGYGLNPELTIELQRENGNDYTNIMSFGITLPQKRTDGEVGEITYVYNGITYRVTETAKLDAQTGIYTYSATLSNIGISNFVLTYQYNVSTGVYTITLPAALFKISELSQVTINASFQKVYSIMFDLGEWADDGSDNGGINSRYFIYQVKNGTAINSDLYNSITGELDSLFSRTQNRAGFTFKGFYTTTSANTLASYGDSFTEMFKNGDGNSVIRGSMNFYARWNYTVALHAPSGIGIESGLSSSLLEENLKDGTDNSIIPIDIQHGFSFEITGTYAGTPRVEVYTVGADGALVPLAVTNVNGVYTVNNPEEITGTIHIYVYADNLTLAVSDTMDATQSSIDLRKDGIFTARYTVNYGSGVNAAEGHAKEIIFSFANSADGTALSLPVGTRLRLFYHANGSAVAVGYYEVGSGGITSVAATDFKPLTGSASSDSATIFDFNGTLTSESLYLVVTLPNNDYTTFRDISSLNITVNAYSTTLTKTPYATAGVTYGDSESGDGTESDSKVQDATDPENTSIQATVNLYDIIHRYGSLSGNTLTFVENDPYANTETAAPEDVRHADKYYVWRIAKNHWTADMVGEGVSYVTTDGYIYVAASNSLSNVDRGDDIVLMEVTNTQYPAAGAIV